LFFDDPNLSVGDRFGSDVVFFGAFQSESIAWEIKAGNLPTSLSERLIGANGAADDLVDAVGRIVLVNDFAFAGIRSDDADTRNGRIVRLGKRTLGRWRAPMCRIG
jgi:hypothetical protein